MCDRNTAREHASGFTLVELLVVIGIIAVLIALLLPVLAAVRRQAMNTACLANLRSLGQAYVIYVNDNRGKAMAFTFTRSDSWVGSFRTQVGIPEKVYLCPVTQESISEDFGSATHAWTMALGTPAGARQIIGSYGFNAWLLREPARQSSIPYSGGPKERYILPNAGGAGDIPLFADATWVDGWPRAEDPAPPDLLNGDRARQGPTLAPKENMMARFTIARHGRSINIVFLDGHAQPTPLTGLKRLKWHNGFAFQDWSPPLIAR